MIPLMIFIFFILAVIGAPIAISLGAASVCAIGLLSDYSLISVAQKMTTQIDSYTLFGATFPACGQADERRRHHRPHL